MPTTGQFWSPRKSKNWFKTGADGFGLQDIARAIKEGAKFSDLANLKNRAKELGLEIGSKVDPYLNYGFHKGSHGNALGKQDIKDFNDRGYNDELKWGLFNKHQDMRKANSNILIGGAAKEVESNLNKSVKKSRGRYKDNIKEQVKKLYKKHLGRDADPKGLERYTNEIINRGWDQSKVADTLKGSPEGKAYAQGTTKKQFIEAKKQGASADWFGPASYNKILNDAYRANGVEGLKSARNAVIKWLDSPSGTKGKTNKDIHLSPHNRTGANTLYAQIKKKNNKTSYWGDRKEGKDGILAGEQISTADIRAMQASGVSDFDVWKYMHKKGSKAWPTTDQKNAYNSLRSSLILKANKEIENKGQSASTTMKHPLWLEVADSFGTLPTGWQDMHHVQLDARWRKRQNVTWDSEKNEWKHGDTDPKSGDYMIKYGNKYLGDHIRSEHKTGKGSQWYKSGDSVIGNAYWSVVTALQRVHNHKEGDLNELWKHLNTSKEFTSFTGTGGGGYLEAGKYWERWGADGPKNSSGEYDLRASQMMAAESLLDDHSDSNAEKILEIMEQKFAEKLWKGSKTKVQGGGRSQVKTIPPSWKDAEDTWGLDIRRLGADGESLDDIKSHYDPKEFKEWIEDNKTGQAWWNRLAYGGRETIDWAFYKTDKNYKAAQEAIGEDDTIDTVREIRRANIWIHGGGSGSADFDEEGRYTKQFRKFNGDYERWGKKDGKMKWIKIDPYRPTQITGADYNKAKDKPNIPFQHVMTRANIIESFRGTGKTTLSAIISNDKVPKQPEAPEISVPKFDVSKPTKLPAGWNVRTTTTTSS